MSTKPKVSVIVITYNQEKYIGETLQSIVDQKTDFSIEIIVADDSSKDSTQDIIAQFAKKYPKTIKPTLRKKNLGAWQNFTDAIRQAKGEYIALCEGDDFWTNNDKLQLQADFLEKNRDYALCFHPVRVFYENNERKDTIFPDKKSEFTTKELLKNNFIQTNSVVYRRQDYADLVQDVMPGDWYLHLYHARFGKIGFIDKVMSAYRRHSEGLWWQSSSAGNMDEIWKKYGTGHLILFTEQLKFFGSTEEYRNIIDENIRNAVLILLRLDSTNNTNLLQRYAENYMESIDGFLSLSRSLKYISDLHDKAMHDYDLYVTQLHEHNNILQRQNQDMTNSLSWRLTQPLRIINKILRGNRN